MKFGLRMKTINLSGDGAVGLMCSGKQINQDVLYQALKRVEDF